MLVAHQLAKSFGDRLVVDAVSLTVHRGEAVGLLGPSGAGKTTVFGILAGIISADRGGVVLDDIEVTWMAPYQRARRGISYLSQNTAALRGLNVEQNIMIALEAHDPDAKRRRRLADALMEEFELRHLRYEPVARLSHGERRRCEIAQALANDPSYLLLDEPFTGIDPIAVTYLRLLIRKLTARNVGVLITDHNVRETLNVVDRAYIIDSGVVLMHGMPDELIRDAEVRKVYLGANFQL
jgi:lipopolysaccharide export system ATP-binding protein